MREIYINQINGTECFSITGTSPTGNIRKKNGPDNTATIRKVSTSDSAAFLKHIKMLLDHWLNKEDGLYYCPLSEIEDAATKTLTYVEGDLQIVHTADSYKDLEPDDSILEPDEAVSKIYQDLKRAKQEEYFAKVRVDSLEASLKVAIKEHMGIRGIASWKATKSTRIDSKALKENYPQVFEECSKVSVSRRFLLE